MNKFNEQYFKKHYKKWNKKGYFNNTFQLYNLLKPKRILDVGCGLGYWMYAFREVWHGVPEIFGCDISSYAIKEANFNLKANICSVGSIKKIPHCKDFADLVICFDVLEHILEKDIDKAIKELRRVSSKQVLCSICFKGDENVDKDETHVNIKSREWWTDKFLEQDLKEEPLPLGYVNDKGELCRLEKSKELILLKKIK